MPTLSNAFIKGLNKTLGSTLSASRMVAHARPRLSSLRTLGG